MNVTWLIHASDDSVMSVMRLIHVCAVWHIQAYHFRKKNQKKKFYECHRTHSKWMWRDSSMRVRTHSWVSCDSFMCVLCDVFRHTIFPQKNHKKNFHQNTHTNHASDRKFVRVVWLTCMCVQCSMTHSNHIICPKKIVNFLHKNLQLWGAEALCLQTSLEAPAYLLVFKDLMCTIQVCIHMHECV